MKPFESFLANQLNEYVSYREDLGYSVKPLRDHLRFLDRYLSQTTADWDCFTPSFFLEMRAKLKMKPATVNKVLSTARYFFQFLIRRGHIAGNPLQDIPLLKEHTPIPFVFSPDQIDHLLETICKRLRKGKTTFLTDLAKYMSVLLMARCGVRISEPLRLLCHHYRPDDGTIYIEKTKFRKDRLIPVPKAVMAEIENYLSVRQALLPNDQNPYLLAAKDQKPFIDQQIRFFFRKSIKVLGLDQSRKIVGKTIFNPPTPHCLRHSFAINTLVAIKARRESPQHALPVLAAYLGHSHYKHTAIYLKVADAISRKNLVDFSMWKRKKK
jgi:integrase/recombinase XerD